MILKICGITNAEDATLACEAGANAIGFNFYPKSPRYILPELAAEIPTPPGVKRVGVFVNEPREHVERVALIARLDVAQLHGDEKPADYPRGFAIWKATRVAGPLNTVDAAKTVPFLNSPIEALLLDGPAGELYGGSGKSFDWTLAAYSSMRIILAGGLDATNVAQAIAMARHAWGVDACSRIESAPGKKDPVKMTAFLAAAREAFRP